MACYHTIAGLEDIFLEDSFVLAVVANPGGVEFDIEVVLRETHSDYTLPVSGEQYCYKRAYLRFIGTTEVNWSMEGIQKSQDANGEYDYGGIDAFEASDAGYSVSGEFGSLEISGGECQFELNVQS